MSFTILTKVTICHILGRNTNIDKISLFVQQFTIKIVLHSDEKTEYRTIEYVNVCQFLEATFQALRYRSIAL